MRNSPILVLAWVFFPLMCMGASAEPDMEVQQSAVYRQSKQMWAQSFLYAKAPELVVEKWIGEKPDIEGKFVLIEFWATWCSACKKAQPLMNSLHDKFGDQLVVIGISDEPEKTVLPHIADKHIPYFMAIDTMARMKDALGVWGIPHVIIIEPGGYVIWEGYPLLEGYTLSETTIRKILEIGNKQAARIPSE